MDKALTQDATTACSGVQARDQQIRRWRALRQHAASCVADLTAVPPFPLRSLLEMADLLAGRIGVNDPREIKLLAILIHNEAWRETVACIPFSRRLLLLPQCLRSRDACPAGRDAFGLLCEACGRCVLGALQEEATALGYAVLIAEGSEAAAGMLQEGHLDAVIGVSCLSALEETFLRIADEALPALAVPLLRDGCDTTDVDVTMLREYIRLIRRVETPPRLSVSDMRASVQAWFEPDALRAVLETGSGHASEIARDWLARSGKRWRPLLTASVYHALQDASAPPRPDLIRAVAVAAECFHKASLIHDDIEDNDAFRYGVATLHKEHGIPIALNVGDLLIGAGYHLLATSPADESARLRMLTAAARAHCGLCVGQGDELQWREQAAVPSPATLIQMFSRKTAPAFEVAMLLGAIAGGADAETCAALSAFSEALGIAYQIGDDLQDIEQDGGERHAVGRQPSMLLSLLCDVCAEAERRDIHAALQHAPDAADTHARIRALVARYGVVAAADALRDDYRDRALQALIPIRAVMLKSVVTRMLNRILPVPKPRRQPAAVNPGTPPVPDATVVVPDATAVAAHARDLLGSEGAARVAAFVQARRDANGLFHDRTGHPDLYYTVFGLSAQVALGAGMPPAADIRPLLADGADSADGRGSFTDWISRIRCLHCLMRLGAAEPGDTRLYARAIDGVNRFRSADGGYAHERQQAGQGTVYAAYLAEQAYRDAGIAWPHAPRVIASLDALRTADGGYTNHPGTHGAITTATAAAIVLLTRYGARARALEAAACLATLRHPDGGYRAAAGVPLPDLLSTATALYAESLCEAATEKPPFSQTAAFIEGLWQRNGGFSGHAADSVADVEYTFHALLALGALAVIHGPADAGHTHTIRPVSNRR